MKLGTEDKLKVKALGGVLVVLVGVLYLQFFSGPATPTGAPTRPRAAAPQAHSAGRQQREIQLAARHLQLVDAVAEAAAQPPLGHPAVGEAQLRRSQVQRLYPHPGGVVGH